MRAWESTSWYVDKEVGIEPNSSTLLRFGLQVSYETPDEFPICPAARRQQRPRRIFAGGERGFFYGSRGVPHGGLRPPSLRNIEKIPRASADASSSFIAVSFFAACSPYPKGISASLRAI